MSIRKAKSLFTATAGILTVLIFTTYFFWIQHIEDNIRRFFLERDVRIALFFSVSLFVSGVLFHFFDDAYFKRWCNGILSWYIPVALIMTVSGSEGFVNPGKEEYALFFSVGLVLLTAVFILGLIISNRRKQKQISLK